MMQEHFNRTKQFLFQRNNDIDIMLFYMMNCKKTVDSTIFKSSIMLMLYNEIEGTFSSVLSELFDYIMDESIDFTHLHKKVRNIYLEYYCKKTSNNMSELIKFRDNTDLKNVDYLEINKYLKLYSGNLDARQIIKISNRIGVKISNNIAWKNILRVKDCRNKLAHGEASFQEACRDYSNNEMRIIADEVNCFLEMILVDYNNFINRQLRIK